VKLAIQIQHQMQLKGQAAGHLSLLGTCHMYIVGIYTYELCFRFKYLQPMLWMELHCHAGFENFSTMY